VLSRKHRQHCETHDRDLHHFKEGRVPEKERLKLRVKDKE
jgi:hypothetical protein